MIRSLFELVDLCDVRIAKEAKTKAKEEEERKSDKRQGSDEIITRRQASETDQLLVARLMIVFKSIWGNGSIGITVDDQGRGGPGVRFVQTAASKISKNKISKNNFLPNETAHLMRLAKKKWLADANP
ncbi:hypothetical protein [Qipengyuania sp. NPDC077563]|uniref:hypothetical protein n=1 Tax=Qipengyuania sp. NPDC077563 TaxID=3364497 RepID=UPI0038508F1F